MSSYLNRKDDTPSTFSSTSINNNDNDKNENNDDNDNDDKFENSSLKLLTSKINETMKDQGYNLEAREKVVGIVTRNIVSCRSESYSRHGFVRAQEGSNDDISNSSSTSSNRRSDVQEVVGGMLRHMLGQDSAIKVNSNEPVLLILFDCISAWLYDDAMGMKGRCLDLLREEWKIWPVRVFIGDLSSSSSSSLSRLKGMGSGFSLTVVNVVNTEVGANMVQLFDDEGGSAEWCNAIVGREAWNRSEWLWGSYEHRCSARVAERLQVDRENGEFLQQDRPDPVSSEVGPDQVAEIGAGDDSRILPDTGVVVDKSAEPTSKDETDRSDGGEGISPPEHPAMAEWRERERQKGHVSHPTWEVQDRRESLYDMIKMQALQVSVVDEGIERGDSCPEI